MAGPSAGGPDSASEILGRRQRGVNKIKNDLGFLLTVRQSVLYCDHVFNPDIWILLWYCCGLVGVTEWLRRLNWNTHAVADQAQVCEHFVSWVQAPRTIRSNCSYGALYPSILSYRTKYRPNIKQINKKFPHTRR